MCRPVEVLRKWSLDNQACNDGNEIIDCTESIAKDLNGIPSNKDNELEIENVFKKIMKGKHQKTRAHMLHNIIIKNRSLFKGHLIEKIEEEMLSGNLLKIFLPWRLQQAIDCSPSGGLNYEGITTLRDAIAMTFPHQKAKEG